MLAGDGAIGSCGVERRKTRYVVVQVSSRTPRLSDPIRGLMRRRCGDGQHETVRTRVLCMNVWDDARDFVFICTRSAGVFCLRCCFAFHGNTGQKTTQTSRHAEGEQWVRRARLKRASAKRAPSPFDRSTYVGRSSVVEACCKWSVVVLHIVLRRLLEDKTKCWACSKKRSGLVRGLGDAVSSLSADRCRHR